MPDNRNALDVLYSTVVDCLTNNHYYITPAYISIWGTAFDKRILLGDGCIRVYTPEGYFNVGYLSQLGSAVYDHAKSEGWIDKWNAYSTSE
jgi:hypothetical protein